jgi:hypothetical protein
VCGVDCRKKIGKAVAELEAETAAMTNLKGPLEFLLKRSGIPVFRLCRIVRKPIRGLISDVLRIVQGK